MCAGLWGCLSAAIHSANYVKKATSLNLNDVLSYFTVDDRYANQVSRAKRPYSISPRYFDSIVIFC